MAIMLPHLSENSRKGSHSDRPFRQAIHSSRSTASETQLRDEIFKARNGLGLTQAQFPDRVELVFGRIDAVAH